MRIARPRTHHALSGCTIAVSGVWGQADAASAAGDVAGTGELGDVLGEAGADVVQIRTPADLRRAVERAGLGRVDAVLFPSSSASWVTTAESAGVLDANRRRAATGRLILFARDEGEAARLHAARLPARSAEQPTATALVRGVLAHYGSGVASLPTDVGRLEVRSGGVVVDERFIPLSPGATGIIEALFLARGRVLSRAELGRSLPGRRSGRAVEVAVARLREALDRRELVQTVVKRGYRLAVAEE
ncbi:winged helix-turn-helix domain-containing protein [Microbacterium sp. MYb62]|uniref:winged helix-turn-helix domain-containing protein n=1 Tax=Microbacterium sp. MYb62 TaxID=1848690 RepID=UPI000CFB55F2|nr:winged helix-turn-helix domain-containing protein [Microbacterium sp. MYb62]PRB13432.1 hypothetical protein CQ042_13305 [Microbacterium sp. MYb62]